MLNTNTPAGAPSGPSPTRTRERKTSRGSIESRQPAVQDTFELPTKLRVHALAKLLEASSREIITTLEALDEPVRSAQSNISREVALLVVRALRPEQLEDPEQPEVTAEPMSEDADAKKSRERDESAAGLTPVFAAPQAMFLAPETQPARAGVPAKTDSKLEQSAEETATKPARKENRDSDDTEEQGGRRRRRRGRRGRGRGRGADTDQMDGGSEEVTERETTSDRSSRSRKNRHGGEEADTGKQETAKSTEPAEEDANLADDAESGEAPGNRRRRRRRRRKGAGEEEGHTREDDPPNTVVHVREAQEAGRAAESSEDEVRSVKGSTRLEAKRQRRRDGREAGRRRAPVLSESEFLARRESVDRKMVVREASGQTQIAVLEDNILVENFVTSAGSGSLVGNVYLGRVQNVLPSMEAAFVDIGKGRNAVLYAGEVDWDAAGLAGKARRIEQALSTGDSVVVQVTKDPVGHKGARLTTQISLPGRFLVYVPSGGATGISRKLPDNERKRLKEILKRIVPDDAGVIIRTASEGTSEEALERDIRRLQAQWDVVKQKAETTQSQSPELLYEEPDLLIKVVRDLFTEDFSSLTVQGDDAWETIEAYVQYVAPDLMSRLSKHVGKNDVFTEQRVNEQIAKALDRKVWLPSGGYLVMDRTEAMTVVDVNTGKFTGSGGNLEETVTRNNLEAAEEIVRQLRLRDIGGIIVIDFIDMVLESNRDLVLRRLTECLGRDRTRHQVAEVTSLGLVQMTRKRVGTGLLEAYSSSCEQCRGRGLLVSTEPVSHAHTNHAGNSGGSRRHRQRGKQSQSSAAASAVTESAQPARPPEPVDTVPTEPASPTSESASSEAVNVEKASSDGEPQPAEHSVATAADRDEKQTEDSANDDRPRRRKVSRPAGSTGGTATPVVVAPKETSAAESGTHEPNANKSRAEAATAVKSRRRGVSRAAGPPVEPSAKESSAASE